MTSPLKIGKKDKLIHFITEVWPRLGEEIFYLRERLRYRSFFKAKEIKFWQDHFAPEAPTVLSGPFRGMCYLNETVVGPLITRWLGTYEQELHAVLISEVFPKTYQKILIIGSAEGYYSCGLGLRFPQIAIYSFETTWISRFQQKRLLSKNKVRNVRVCGRLDLNHFQELVSGGRTLCLLDIEGFEYEFCSTRTATALKHADLIIEIHAYKNLSAEIVQQSIEKAIHASHQIKILEPEDRDFSRFQKELPPSIDQAEFSEAVNEHRGFPQKWIWAKAKHPTP